jgi:hypothetical protein
VTHPAANIQLMAAQRLAYPCDSVAAALETVRHEHNEQLEAAGYTVDLQYAGEYDIPTQVSIENMISSGCDVQ